MSTNLREEHYNEEKALARQYGWNLDQTDASPFQWLKNKLEELQSDLSNSTRNHLAKDEELVQLREGKVQVMNELASVRREVDGLSSKVAAMYAWLSSVAPALGGGHAHMAYVEALR